MSDDILCPLLVQGHPRALWIAQPDLQGLGLDPALGLLLLAVTVVVLWLLISRIWKRALHRRLEQLAAGSPEGDGFYRAFVESTPALICRFLPGGEVTFVNKAYCDFFRLTSAELVGASFRSRVPEQDWDALMASLSTLSAAAPTQSHEHRVISPDGQILWQRWTNTALFDNDGELVAYQSLGEGITERKRAEEALQESEEKFRSLVTNSPEQIMILDREGMILDINHTVPGLRVEDVLGTSVWDDTPDEYREVAQACFRRVLETGTPYGYETVYHPACGGSRHFNVHLAPRLRDGNVVGLVSRSTDITLRKLADLQLREERDRAQTYLDLAGVMFVAVDVAGTVTLVNQKTCEVLGYSEDEVVGTNWFDNYLPERIRGRVRKVAEQLLEGEVEPAEYHENLVLTKDGEERLIAWHNTYLRDDAGAIIGHLCSGEDVTVRRRAEADRLALERQMQQAQKLESLGILAGGIAHDFNNLLLAIVGNVDLALASVTPGSPASSNLAEINKASRRAAELAQQMLDYSGKGRFVVEPIDLEQLVDETAHLLEVSISKKAELSFDFAERPPRFDGDATQIRQVIMNLITNASEAIGDQSGVITLSTGERFCDRGYLDEVVEVIHAGLDEPLQEGMYVFVEVADTGCGMESETLERIFDPFFTTKFTGRGLGMSAIIGIVRGHRGALRVTSAPGEGTSFTVLFPAREQAAESSEPKNGNAALGDKRWRGSGTILIVDDEQAVCTVTKHMIERMGFSAMTAFDGRGSVEVFRKHASEITCVLLDLTMPHMDGVETFREFRKIDPFVTVILCSGYSEQKATERFVGKGLASFLQKPYGMAALREKLRRVLG